MNVPRDYCSKWSKQDRERKITYDNTYIWNLKKNDTNEISKQKEIHKHTNKLNSYQRGRRRRDKLRVWG